MATSNPDTIRLVQGVLYGEATRMYQEEQLKSVHRRSRVTTMHSVWWGGTSRLVAKVTKGVIKRGNDVVDGGRKATAREQLASSRLGGLSKRARREVVRLALFGNTANDIVRVSRLPYPASNVSPETNGPFMSVRRTKFFGGRVLSVVTAPRPKPYTHLANTAEHRIVPAPAAPARGTAKVDGAYVHPWFGTDSTAVIPTERLRDADRL